MSWLRHRLGGPIVPALVVGVVVFHLIRSHVCERYRVRSRSMEPTLHGDPDHGDIVLVNRVAWWFDDPCPGDLVVLRNEDESGNHLVKRVAAVGPAVLEFRAGDVFVGPSRQSLERVVKDPVRQRDRRIRHASLRDDATTLLHPDDARWSRDGDVVTLRPVASADALRAATTTAAQDARRGVDPYLPGHLSLARPVGNDFVDARGVVQPGLGPMPRDIGFTLDVSWPTDMAMPTLHLVHEYAETYFGLLVEPGGALSLTRYGEPVAQGSMPAIPAAQSAARLEFGYLDGRFFLVVDGRLVFEHAVELPSQSRLVLVAADRFSNLLHLGVAGPAPLTIHAIDVFRDAHYESRVPLYRIAPDQLFVLGDNATDSADSRDRPNDPFDRDDVLGRPFAVIGPFDRARWLDRYSEDAP